MAHHMAQQSHYDRYDFIDKKEQIFLDISHQNDATLQHSHDFYEVVAITHGRGTHSINDKTYQVMPGDIFLMHPGDYHMMIPADKNTTFKWLSCIWLPEFYHLNDPILLNTKKYNDEYTLDITNMFLDMMREFNLKQQDYLEIIHHQLIALLKKLKRIASNAKDNYADRYKNALVKKAVDFINTNYQQNLDLQNIADQLQISQVYLCKLFKNQMEISTIQYLRKVRVDNAIKLLMTTDMTVNQISAQVGFSDVKNFIFAFKKAAQTTPLKFRKFSTGQTDGIV